MDSKSLSEQAEFSQLEIFTVLLRLEGLANNSVQSISVLIFHKKGF